MSLQERLLAAKKRDEERERVRLGTAGVASSGGSSSSTGFSFSPSSSGFSFADKSGSSGSSGSRTAELKSIENPYEEYITVDIPKKLQFERTQLAGELEAKREFLEKDIRSKQDKLSEYNQKLDELYVLMGRVSDDDEKESAMMSKRWTSVLFIVVSVINLICMSLMQYQLDKIERKDDVRKTRAYTGGLLALAICQFIVGIVLLVLRKDWFIVALLITQAMTIGIASGLITSSDLANSADVNAPVIAYIYFAINIVVLLGLFVYGVSKIASMIAERRRKKAKKA